MGLTSLAIYHSYVYSLFMNVFEYLQELDEESEFLVYDDLDSAFVGSTQVFVPHESGGMTRELVAVYDWHLLVEALMADGIETVGEAEEYISFNIDGAYLGPQTPLILNRPEWVTVNTLYK